jgi:hypothetical protein
MKESEPVKKPEPGKGMSQETGRISSVSQKPGKGERAAEKFSKR